MDSSEAAVVIITVVVGLALSLLPFLFVILAVLLPPRLLRKRIASWTEGKTNQEIWNALEDGATRGGFQFRPASFLHEAELTTRLFPEQAVQQVTAFFSQGWGRSVIAADAQSVAFSMRYLPFLATDVGWIGMAWAVADPAGTKVRFRFRSTYMWPVITVFLTFRLQLYVLNRVLP